MAFKLYHGVWRVGSRVNNVYPLVLNKDIYLVFLKLLMELGRASQCRSSPGTQFGSRLIYGTLPSLLTSQLVHQNNLKFLSSSSSYPQGPGVNQQFRSYKLLSIRDEPRNNVQLLVAKHESNPQLLKFVQAVITRKSHFLIYDSYSHLLSLVSQFQTKREQSLP